MLNLHSFIKASTGGAAASEPSASASTLSPGAPGLIRLLIWSKKKQLRRN